MTMNQMTKFLGIAILLLIFGCTQDPDSSTMEMASEEIVAQTADQKNNEKVERKLIKEGRVEFETNNISSTRKTIFEAVVTTDQVPDAVKNIVKQVERSMTRASIQAKLNIRHRDYFREEFLDPAIEQAFIEMTIPDKPRSSKQRYRLTKKGEALKKKLTS